jgi:hypothetical protein
LRELKAKADRVYQQYRNRHAAPALDIQLSIGPEAEVSASRLAIFGGQTRVMSSKLLSRKRPAKRASQPTFSPSAGPSPSVASADSPPQERDSSPGVGTSASTPSDSGSSVPQNVSEAFAQVHPSLVEYLSLFPSSASLAVVEPPPQQALMNGSGSSDVEMNGSGINGSSVGLPSALSTASMSPQPSMSFVQGVSRVPEPPAAFQPLYPDLSPPQANMAPQMPTQSVNPMAGMMGFYSGDPNVAALSMSELGFSEDVTMTEHWMNLMRQTGILDSNGNYATSSSQDQQTPQSQQPPQHPYIPRY